MPLMARMYDHRKLFVKIYKAILFIFSGRTIEINTNPDLTL